MRLADTVLKPKTVINALMVQCHRKDRRAAFYRTYERQASDELALRYRAQSVLTGVMHEIPEVPSVAEARDIIKWAERTPAL